MNKVITINLNGRAYQLEESGYEALRAYLDEASANLADDPGKAEIVVDLEQAIAEKCDKVLNPHKTVVAADEIQKVINEMGPVEGGAKEKSGSGKSSRENPQAPRRFFLIREGAVFTGVCAGIAAYFNIDVTVVRIAFIALTVFTGGIWILFYLALALLVPYADTAEARAQAHGEPFNAEALVQRAKERWIESYERVTGGKWDEQSDFADAMKAPGGALRSAHEQHLKWRAERKQQKRQWKQQWKYNHSYYRSNPLLGLLRGVLAVLWILAEVSLISTGAIFGWMIPAGIPIWVAVVLLFVLYHAVTGPMKGARYSSDWNSSAQGGNGYQYNYTYSEWDGLADGLSVLFLAIALGWAYLHIPQVYFFAHHPIIGSHEVGTYIKSLFNR